MTSLDQFPTRAAGLPDFAIQDTFLQLASVHEPVAGLENSITAGYDGEELGL